MAKEKADRHLVVVHLEFWVSNEQLIDAGLKKLEEDLKETVLQKARNLNTKKAGKEDGSEAGFNLATYRA